MITRLYEHLSNEDLIREVNLVLDGMQVALDSIDETLYSNVIDPFSSLFDASIQNITFEDWLMQEKMRQIQKTLANKVGDFHEHVLGLISGWVRLEAGGYDIENPDKKIIAEIKNKHNTMNSSTSEAIYTKMVEFLDDTKDGYTAYVVTVIPRTPRRFDRTFNPSVRGTRLPEREDIRITDGATFYEIATGDPDALIKLYKALPAAITQIKEFSKETYSPEIERFESLFIRAFAS